uniref:Uncharacterized protein n=1 Tax=Papio anubis TaxID=9555 RepID=A0A8I5NIC3_PAPAN
MSGSLKNHFNTFLSSLPFEFDQFILRAYFSDICSLFFLQYFLQYSKERTKQSLKGHRDLGYSMENTKSFVWQSITLSPSLECRGTILAHYRLCLPGSGDRPPLASSVAGTTGMHHHTQVIFVFLVEIGFPHFDQDCLILLTSGDPPTLAFKNSEITSVSHHTQPNYTFLFSLYFQK